MANKDSLWKLIALLAAVVASAATGITGYASSRVEEALGDMHRLEVTVAVIENRMNTMERRHLQENH